MPGTGPGLGLGLGLELGPGPEKDLCNEATNAVNVGVSKEATRPESIFDIVIVLLAMAIVMPPTNTFNKTTKKVLAVIVNKGSGLLLWLIHFIDNRLPQLRPQKYVDM